jgi:hypothetical protein
MQWIGDERSLLVRISFMVPGIGYSQLTPEEKRRLALIVVPSFFLSATTLFLLSVLQSFVAARAGADRLPTFYIMVAIGGLLGAWLLLIPLRRWRAAGQGLLMLVAAFPAAAWLAITQQHLTAASSGAALLAFMVNGAFVASALVIATDKLRVVIADCFDYNKISFAEPIVSTAFMMGTVTAGFGVIVVSLTSGTSMLFLAVPVLLAIAIPFYARLWVETGMGKQDAESAESTWKDRFRALRKEDGLRTLALHIAVLYGLSVIFGRLFSYQFVLAAGSRFSSEASLNAFMGFYGVILGLTHSIFVLIYRRKILAKLGLLLTEHIPTFIVGMLLVIVGVYPVFFTVIPLILTRDVIMSIQQFIFMTMLGIAPNHERNRIWSFIDGPVTTGADLLGSALLLPFTPQLWGGSYGACAAVAWFALVLIFVRYGLTLRMHRVYPLMVEQQLQLGKDPQVRLRAMQAIAEVHSVDPKLAALLTRTVQNQQEPYELRVAATNALAAFEDRNNRSLKS